VDYHGGEISSRVYSLRITLPGRWEVVEALLIIRLLASTSPEVYHRSTYDLRILSGFHETIPTIADIGVVQIVSPIFDR